MDTDFNRKQSHGRKMGATENARGMQGLNRRFWDKQHKIPLTTAMVL
jgi:hypothetical protein